MRRVVALLAFVVTLALLPAIAEARVTVRVDLSSQTMSVHNGKGAAHRWAISSGRSGYRTPNGVYSPKRLATYHYSRKYRGAMPHSVFFRGGYAIHGTGAVGLLGRPASHGCIRLHPANAAKLFGMIRANGGRATIVISGATPSGPKFADASPTKHKKAKVKGKTMHYPAAAMFGGAGFPGHPQAVYHGWPARMR